MVAIYLRKAHVVLGLCASLVLPLARASEVVDDSFQSAALGRPYKMRLYLPDAFKSKPQPRLPVIYLLHGSGGDETWWSTRGGAKETLDTLINRGQLRPSIVVMPANGSNWYVDAPSAKSESALIGELLPFVEARYRTAQERSARMIGGLSMGGYGALNLALKHADQFCAAMLMSPAVYDPVPPGLSSALRDEPFAIDGRFDVALWSSHNYPAHLEAYQKQGKTVSFWIMSGDHDRYGIALEAAKLYTRLLSLQPKQVELRIVDGDHEAFVWRDALPDALRYADEQCQRHR